MLRMDEFNKINKDFKVNQLSINKISKKYCRSWATIKRVVTLPSDQIESRGKRPRRKPTVLTQEIKKRIYSLLKEEKEKKVHKKHTLTAHAIYTILKEEGRYKGSEKSVRREVSEQRKILKLKKEKTFLELDFSKPGTLQVDHGPVELKISGERVTGYLFVASIPGKVIRYCQTYLTKAKESWWDFHEKTFDFFGCTFNSIIYDNDSVLKINSNNTETSFSIELQSHYGFKAVYCNKAAGWEKGSVEGGVGYCRRNFLPGIKSFANIEEDNSYLEEKSFNDISTRTHYRTGRPLIELLGEVTKALPSFKSNGQDWGHWHIRKVNKFQYVTYKTYRYSVPIRYVGEKVKVFATIRHIKIYENDQLICTHDRLYLSQDSSLKLNHYLEQLQAKPGALSHARVLKQCKYSIEIHELQDRIYRRYESKEAADHFLQILMLKRTSSEDEFRQMLKQAKKFDLTNYAAIKSVLHSIQRGIFVDTTTCTEISIDSQYDLNNYTQLLQ